MEILSKLNTNGSGLNISELSESLTTAEIEPRKALVSGRIDKAELGLSGYERLRAQMQTLDEAMGLMAGLQPRQLTSDSSAVRVQLDDPQALDGTGASLRVDSLAQSQVLNFGGFSGPDAQIGSGAMTVAFGTWSQETPPVFNPGAPEAKTINFSAGSTLADMAEALNMLDGVTARVIEVGDGSYTLGVISQTGAAQALRFSVAPDAEAGLSAFDFASDPSAVQVQGAADAMLSFNGIAVTRPSNEISDLMPGATLSLTAVTAMPVTLSEVANVEGSLAVMGGFVEMLNATRALIDGLTARGFGAGSTKGDLAGDALTEGVQRQLETLIGQAFGVSGTHLADLGVVTERDGTLRLDEGKFSALVSKDPSVMDALVRDHLTGQGVTITGAPAAGTKGGSFQITRDPLTGAAELGGVALSGYAQADGSWSYYVGAGPMKGLRLTTEGTSDGATLRFEPSLVSNIGAYLDTVLAENGVLGARERALQSTVSEETEGLEALDKRAEDLRARYLSKFTEMERVVTMLNSTGDYLTNLIDAWNSDN